MTTLESRFQQENASLSHDSPFIWTTTRFMEFYCRYRRGNSKRSAERFLREQNWIPDSLTLNSLADENDRSLKQIVAQILLQNAKQKRWVSLFIQLHESPLGTVVVANNARQARYWALVSKSTIDTDTPLLTELLTNIARTASANPVLYWPHGELCQPCRDLSVANHVQNSYQLALSAYQPAMRFAIN